MRWQRRPWAGAAALALAYLGLGLLWIVFSDQLGGLLFDTPPALTAFQTWKGVGFVVLTAALLFVATARWPRQAAPAAPAAGRRGPPLWLLLWLLVLAMVLAMTGLLGWHVLRESDLQAASARRLVNDVAASVAADAASLFDGKARLAVSLAQRGAVRLLDSRRCDPLLAELGALDEALVEASTFDAAGQLVCGREARRADPAPDWLEPLRRTREPLVGALARNPVGGGWSFPVVQPIVSVDGQLLGAIELLVSTSALHAIVEAAVPPGGAIALVDPRDALAARFPAVPERVGNLPVDPGRARRLRAAIEGEAFSEAGVDGTVRLLDSAAIDRTGWLAAAGVPVDDFQQPARQAFARSLLVASGIALLCGLLVLWLARRITGPLRGLQQTAEAAAAGDFSVRAPEHGPAELGAVAEGFNRMLEQLPRLQQRLRDSEEHHRTLLDKLSRNVPGVVFMHRLAPDGRTTIPYANERLRTVLELEPADVAQDARLVMERIHPGDRPRVEAAMAQSRQALAGFTEQFRVQLPRGGLRHVLVQAHPEREPDGSVVWYSSLTDITELHEAQRSLEEVNATLEQRIAERTAALAAANEALESFSYSVAHDLRAPLSSIDGFAHGMAQALERGDADRARGYAARVGRNAQRMNLLIEGFLALARAGRAPLVDSPVNTQRLVAEVLADLAPPAHAQVEVGTLPRVRVDQATFRQAWHNLLSNALKYSSRRERPAVVVGCEALHDELVFRVVDNGAGFDPEYAGKLFTPFGRLHKAEEFEGTGVGLALVRRIVERHGGRIWARSHPESGATFCFTLPRERLLPGAGDAPTL